MTRLHLEQDAGKSLHDQDPARSFIDLNRAGVALMEIVSEPDMRSPEEAGAYLRKLRTILRYLGTCDGNMDEGSMRADVNVSVRAPASRSAPAARSRTSTPCASSCRRSRPRRAARSSVWEGGGTVEQETRLFDPARGDTRSMRSKEDAHDYRYFPDPDLLPLVLDAGVGGRAARGLPELPDAKRARFVAQYGLPAYDAGVLVAEQATADVLRDGGAGPRRASLAANWVTGDLFAALNRTGRTIATSPVSAAALGGLLDLMADNTINGRIAKDVFEAMVETGEDAGAIVEARACARSRTPAPSTRRGAGAGRQPGQAARVPGGKDKLFGFFVGQVMKAMAGKGNPALVNEALKRRLAQ